MKQSNFILDKVTSATLWTDVPTYQHIDWKYIFRMLFRAKSLRLYIFAISTDLLYRKKCNQEYKEFWANEDKYIFNEDKTQYIAMHFNQIGDVTIE